jgi:hypothetical protein
MFVARQFDIRETAWQQRRRMSRNAVMIRHIASTERRAVSTLASAGLWILCCVALLMATGCVSRTQGVPHRVVINQPFEKAWPVIVKVAQQLNPDVLADKSTGTVTTGEFPALHNLSMEDCAEPPGWRYFPTWTDTRFAATFTGRELNANQTEVTFRCDFYRFDSDSERWSVWHSRGRLEPLILAQLEGKETPEPSANADRYAAAGCVLPDIRKSR